ncbi:MAG: glycosyltransferase family 4 protein [Anaerolineaceae bacterium]
MSINSLHVKKHCMIVFAIYPLGETRVQREAEALVKNGFEVDVICFHLRGEPSIDEYKGVKIYREKDLLPISHARSNGLFGKFLEYLSFFVMAAIRVTKLHFQKHYSTIQVHNLPDFLVFSTLIPKLMRVPIILDLHDLMPEFFASRTGNSKSLLARLIRFQERMACKYADHVITVSAHWRKSLIQRGVPQEKCSVVMNVADETIFYPSKQVRDQTQNIDSFRLIYHGTFVERYGLDLAIRAIDQVRLEIPGIHLTLVGWGEFLPEMIEMIDQLGLKDHVTIENLHLAEELPEIIHSCDLGIVAYNNDIFTDGLLPTKLMEYAAMGLPVIASRTTAISAYFSDSNVEFFEPGNLDDLVRCIIMLYKNPDRMCELAYKSQNFNRRYNWPQISKEYISLVDRLSGKKTELKGSKT